MSEAENQNFGKDREEIFSKALRAGRRTYFFDVRETRAGDYYLTVTESKKNTNDDGSFYYKKHKIYIYKEDFENFRECLDETTDFILKEKGEEVISDTHQKDFEPSESSESSDNDNSSTGNFADVNFEDI